MHDLSSPFFLRRPRAPWWVDATRLELSAPDLDRLDWDHVFASMAELERGVLANPSEERQVGHYWLRSPQRAPTIGQAEAIGEALEQVHHFARGILDGRITAEAGTPFTDLLHIGVGGSSVGPMLLVDALSQRTGLNVHFIDNTDPEGIERVLTSLSRRLDRTVIVVTTKSGTTVETLNALRLTEHALHAHALEPARHLVAITSEGTTLAERARRDWLACFPLWSWVGGRTSVTSAVGLLPAALAGIDTQELLAGAREMDEWTRVPTWRDNPAALLAGCWLVLGRGVGARHLVALPYSDRLVLLPHYLQQLLMESLGKATLVDGTPTSQGLTVYGTKGSTAQHTFVQQLRDGRDDFFVTFLQVLATGSHGAARPEAHTLAGDYLQGFLLGTRRALADRGRPSITLTLETLDPRTLGGLIALFERTVGFYATLVGVNAYDQPGVEAGKRAADDILQLSTRIRTLLGEEEHTVHSLAARLDADATEVFYLLHHLRHTHRLLVEGDDLSARWRAPRGADAT